MRTIGLIAGNRRFPVIFAQEAAKRGVRVEAVAIRGETDPSLKRYVHSLQWLPLQDYSGLFSLLAKAGVSEVVMAGQISPMRLFSREVRQSQEIQRLLSRITDHKANTIFEAIAQDLARHNITLLDSTTFLESYLPKPGVLTVNKPAPAQMEDIAFGFDLAKKIAALDVGLSVGIKQKAIVAVEALEGTDNLIRRAGRLARRDVVIVKVGRPGQDMRYDIPVIGLQTVRTLISVRAACLAFEAGSTLFLDREDAVRMADRAGLVIAAVTGFEKNS